MERIELRESRRKSIFWGSVCLFAVAFFAYGAFIYAPLCAVLAVGFLAGAILFLTAAANPKLLVIVDDSGIWNSIVKERVAWEDVGSLELESGMLVLELKDVSKYFPTSSRLVKAIVKRTLIDLSMAEGDIDGLIRFVESKLSTSVTRR